MLTTTFRPLILHHIRVCGSPFLFCSVSVGTTPKIGRWTKWTFNFSLSVKSRVRCFASFTSCVVKRPFSSFCTHHRRNISTVGSHRHYTSKRSMWNPHFHHAIVGIRLVQIGSNATHMIGLSKLRQVTLLFYNFIIIRSFNLITINFVNILTVIIIDYLLLIII